MKAFAALNVIHNILRLYFWWSLCTLYLLTGQVWVAVGDSGRGCRVCLFSWWRSTVRSTLTWENHVPYQQELLQPIIHWPQMTALQYERLLIYSQRHTDRKWQLQQELLQSPKYCSFNVNCYLFTVSETLTYWAQMIALSIWTITYLQSERHWPEMTIHSSKKTVTVTKILGSDDRSFNIYC